MSTQTTELLEAAAKILLRCWLFGFLLLLFSVGVVMPFADSFHYVFGKIVYLTLHELSLMHYCGIHVVGLFFFIPWLSIRLVLRKAKA
jgi:hypothetical protein